jgi:hypothetical protein
MLLLEHVRATDPGIAVWQDRIEPAWKVLARGCHPNRATLSAVEAAGFEIVERHDLQLGIPGERFVPHVAAVAARRGANGAATP